MKKIIAVVLSIMLMMSIVTPAMASGNVGVVLDGNRLNFDVPPTEINGRVLVPVRVIFEALGATVGWDDATRTVSANKGETNILLQLDNNIMMVNEKKVTLDVAATEIGGRTLVPVRAISEAFGVYVSWDDVTQTVVLSTTVSDDPAKIAAENFMDAYILWDAENAVKYADNPQAVKNNIANNEKQLVDAFVPALNELGIAGDNEGFVEFLDAYLTNLFGSISYKITGEVKIANEAIYVVDVSIPTGNDMEYILGSLDGEAVAEKLLSEGKINASMSEETMYNILMTEVFKEAAKLVKNADLETETEEYSIVVTNHNGQWLVNTARSEIY